HRLTPGIARAQTIQRPTHGASPWSVSRSTILRIAGTMLQTCPLRRKRLLFNTIQHGHGNVARESSRRKPFRLWPCCRCGAPLYTHSLKNSLSPAWPEASTHLPQRCPYPIFPLTSARTSAAAPERSLAMPSHPIAYETDFYAWVHDQAALLAARRF